MLFANEGNLIALCIYCSTDLLVTNPIYRAPKALASEALAAGQSWLLIKSFTEEVRLKPRFKDIRRVNADYCLKQRVIIINDSIYPTVSKASRTGSVPDSWRRTAKGSSREVCLGERLVQ